MVGSVVGVPDYSPELSINSTNSTVPGSESYLPDRLDYMGLWGSSSWKCEAHYNKALDATSEFNKWGSSSASAIMALLPALIAITSAVTANIGFLCHLSPAQGLFAAALTFGFPVRQLNTWKSVTISVKDLLKLPHDEDVIVLNGVEEKLIPIKKLALSPRRLRLIWVRLFRLLFGLGQGVLIWCLLVAVPKIDSFTLIWLCPVWGDKVFILWMGATFTVLGWLRARFERNAFGRDEVIYISKAQRTGNNWQRLLDPHPVIVILRPSNHGQAHTPHYIDYFIGLSQILWICLLSFLLSSTIGGSLFTTLIMVVTFITIVHVSRGLSILACVVAQKHLNLRVIEYDNLREKGMVQILLGGLTGVIMDIHWVNFKKSQWEESVKMYEWGYKFSRGIVMEGQCKIHTKIQQTDNRTTFFLRNAALVLFYEAGLVLAYLLAMLSYPNPNESTLGTAIGSHLLLGVGIAACWNLGQAKKFLICDCD